MRSRSPEERPVSLARTRFLARTVQGPTAPRPDNSTGHQILPILKDHFRSHVGHDHRAAAHWFIQSWQRGDPAAFRRLIPHVDDPVTGLPTYPDWKVTASDERTIPFSPAAFDPILAMIIHHHPVRKASALRTTAWGRTIGIQGPTNPRGMENRDELLNLAFDTWEWYRRVWMEPLIFIVKKTWVDLDRRFDLDSDVMQNLDRYGLKYSATATIANHRTPLEMVAIGKVDDLHLLGLLLHFTPNVTRPLHNGNGTLAHALARAGWNGQAFQLLGAAIPAAQLPAFLDIQDSQGFTALMICAMASLPGPVQVLLQLGASITIQSNPVRNASALHLAVFQFGKTRQHTRSSQTACILFDAHPESHNYHPDQYGITTRWPYRSVWGNNLLGLCRARLSVVEMTDDRFDALVAHIPGVYQADPDLCLCQCNELFEHACKRGYRFPNEYPLAAAFGPFHEYASDQKMLLPRLRASLWVPGYTYDLRCRPLKKRKPRDIQGPHQSGS